MIRHVSTPARMNMYVSVMISCMWYTYILSYICSRGSLLLNLFFDHSPAYHCITILKYFVCLVLVVYYFIFIARSVGPAAPFHINTG